MWDRIAAILVGIAILFALERWSSVPWYFSAPAAVLGYLCVRYIGYFIRERRYISDMTEEAVRISKDRDQISN
jgi:hypothetical protein